MFVVLPVVRLTMIAHLTIIANIHGLHRALASDLFMTYVLYFLVFSDLLIYYYSNFIHCTNSDFLIENDFWLICTTWHWVITKQLP